MSRLSVSWINTSANRNRVCISTLIESFVFSIYVSLTKEAEYQQYRSQTLYPAENKALILVYHLLILCADSLCRHFLGRREVVFRQFPQRQMRLLSANEREQNYFKMREVDWWRRRWWRCRRGKVLVGHIRLPLLRRKRKRKWRRLMSDLTVIVVVVIVIVAAGMQKHVLRMRRDERIHRARKRGGERRHGDYSGIIARRVVCPQRNVKHSKNARVKIETLEIGVGRQGKDRQPLEPNSHQPSSLHDAGNSTAST